MERQSAGGKFTTRKRFQHYKWKSAQGVGGKTRLVEIYLCDPYIKIFCGELYIAITTDCLVNSCVCTN